MEELSAFTTESEKLKDSFSMWTEDGKAIGKRTTEGMLGASQRDVGWRLPRRWGGTVLSCLLRRLVLLRSCRGLKGNSVPRQSRQLRPSECFGLQSGRSRKASGPLVTFNGTLYISKINSND